MASRSPVRAADAARLNTPLPLSLRPSLEAPLEQPTWQPSGSGIWNELCGAPVSGHNIKKSIIKGAGGSVRVHSATLPPLQKTTELRAMLTRDHEALLRQLHENHRRLLRRVVGDSFEDWPDLQSQHQGPEEQKAQRGDAKPTDMVPMKFEAKQNVSVNVFVQTDACEFATAQDAIKPDSVIAIEALVKQPAITAPVPSPGSNANSYAKDISLNMNEHAIAMQGVSNTDLSWGFRFEHFVVGPIFETIFATLIMSNAIVMAFEAQYKGFDNGFKIQYMGADRSAKDVWPGADTVFQNLETTFGILFVFELVIKICVLRFSFVKCWWNFLDLIVVVSWVLDAGFHVNSFLNPMMLRLFRLVKLLRVAKLFKSFQSFDSLSLLIGSLRASASILFWSIVVIFLLQMVAALFFCQVLQEYIVDESQKSRTEIYDRFGTFTRAFVTMLELTIGQWGPILQLLVQNVSEWYAIFVIIYVLFVSFATIKVISAVFILETQKLAASDEEILIMQKDRANSRLEANILSVFKEIDHSGDGCLGPLEFQQIISDRRMRTYLAALELETQHCDGLFEQLDTDGDGSISLDEFMCGVCRLKGAAKSSDLVAVAFQQKVMSKTIQRIADIVELKFADAAIDAKKLRY